MLAIRVMACVGLLGISAIGVFFAFKNAGRDLQASALAVAAVSLLLAYFVIHPPPAGLPHTDVPAAASEATSQPGE